MEVVSDIGSNNIEPIYLNQGRAHNFQGGPPGVCKGGGKGVDGLRLITDCIGGGVGVGAGRTPLT